jgi:hypothetical protein
MPDAVVAAWHRAILGEPIASEAGGVLERVPAEERLAPLANRFADGYPGERMRLRFWAQSGLPPRLRCRRATRRPRAPGRRCTPFAGRSSIGRAKRAPAGPELRFHTGSGPRCSVLPFPLLGPLHRIGWLGLLDATLAAADLESRLPAFATALATKVLPEPERGWRRTPDSEAAASAFAGDAGPRPGAEVSDLARAAAELTPALDAAIPRSLIDGRRVDDPLLVVSADGVRLLVDPDGAFLIAGAGSADPAAFAVSPGGARSSFRRMRGARLLKRSTRPARRSHVRASCAR